MAGTLVHMHVLVQRTSTSVATGYRYLKHLTLYEVYMSSYNKYN